MSDPYKFLSSIGQVHLTSAIGILFNHDEDLLYFFFSHKERALRIPAKNMVQEASKFVLSEQLLIRVALDFWNRRGAARLADMVTEWDMEYWIRFIHATTYLHEIKDEVADTLKKGLGS